MGKAKSEKKVSKCIEAKATEFEILELMQTLQNSGDKFTAVRTGYTVKIKSENFGDFLFSTDQPHKLFLFFLSKLKAEVKGKHFQVNKQEVFYYLFREISSVPEKMYLVDLNSAYLQALKNEGIISEDLFNYGSKLPKQDRLKGVGALATIKSIYEFEDGNFSVSLKDSETASIFFYACKIIGDLLKAASRIFPSFIFFWVDGAYFSDFQEAQNARDFFELRGYPCKIELCESCKISDSGKSLIYKKDGKLKVFSLPNKSDKFTDEKIIQFLTK